MELDGQTAVLGTAMPGLADSLRLTEFEPLEDTEIPAYFEVSADVTDFSLDFTATILTPSALDDLDTGDLSDFDDLSDMLDDLTDAADALTDGTGTLADGAQELHDGVQEFSDKSSGDLSDDLGSGLRNVVRRLKAVQQAGKNYQTFSGLPAGSTGSVKFIIETAEIKK